MVYYRVVMVFFSGRPTLVSSADYAAEVTKAIKKASARIAIVATTFRDDDPRTHDIMEALAEAGDRGVLISVGVDIFTYIEPKELILRSPKRQPARAYQALKLERRLKKHGINFRWLGRTSNLTFSGRTHSKWVIIDDDVYAFGGINLDNDSFNNTDYMFRFRDQELAQRLFNEHLRLVGADRGAHATKSRKISLSEASTVLIDGGFPGDSLIYRRAVTLAKEARSIVLVSQYCPTGKLNRILRRKQAIIYFNHWRRAAWLNKLMIRFGMLFARQQTLYTGTPYLHAKFMICTMADGKKVAITGSHNFMFGSGMIGTREIALETSDKHIIAQLEEFLEKRVK